MWSLAPWEKSQVVIHDANPNSVGKQQGFVIRGRFLRYSPVEFISKKGGKMDLVAE